MKVSKILDELTTESKPQTTIKPIEISSSPLKVLDPSAGETIAEEPSAEDTEPDGSTTTMSESLPGTHPMDPKWTLEAIEDDDDKACAVPEKTGFAGVFTAFVIGLSPVLLHVISDSVNAAAGPGFCPIQAVFSSACPA